MLQRVFLRPTKGLEEREAFSEEFGGKWEMYRSCWKKEKTEFSALRVSDTGFV